MRATIEFQNKTYTADLTAPIDISIPLREGLQNVNCFYAPPMSTSPVEAGDFIGSTAQGGPLNFLNVCLNPHGNGTHTECIGHIAKERYTINQCLRQFMHVAEVVTIFPRKTEQGDRVIFADQVKEVVQYPGTAALIIRTLPNDDLKMETNHSGANPPYMHHDAIHLLTGMGVQHLLVDIPSVDREEDGGELLSHKAFWQYPENPRAERTISELIYIRPKVKDGLYLLNMQIASFEIDVSPSKPVIYALHGRDNS